MAHPHPTQSIDSLIGEITSLSEEDRALLQRLRRERPDRQPPALQPPTTGGRVADWIAAVVGSWPFVIAQSLLLTLWILVNIFAWVQAWDPYPFILLNLMLSFQAAYTAPIILMSQNRQAMLDRQDQANDYDVNLKAELEIELLHHKIDLLRSKEIQLLTELVKDLSQKLAAREVSSG
ncbi:DUF1003 domain-containing protein [Dongia sp. agr-C8]